MNLLFRAYHYCIHFVSSLRHTRGFGVQAPFAFDLLNQAIRSKNRYYIFNVLDAKRKELLHSKQKIQVEDFGARGYRKYEAVIGEVLVQSVKNKKYQEILFRLVNFMKPETILELGTSLGLTTAYLASVNSKAQVVTIEASHGQALKAVEIWKELKINNITLIEETFDNSLEKVLYRIKKIDFVFIDGNHRGDALLRYYNTILPYCSEKSIIVVDDIYWNCDMLNAWKKIENDKSVQVSFNLFQMGIAIVHASELSPANYRVLI